MMSITPRHDIRKARRRRRRADDVLIALSIAGVADATILAEATNLSPSRVIKIMEGGLPQYRPDYSYIAQGLVTKVSAARATYAVTSHGLRVAAEVQADQAKRSAETRELAARALDRL